MDEKTFLKKMKEDILDTETEIDMNTPPLCDIEEWDSLSMVDFIAMANVVFKKNLTMSEISKAETFADLYKLIS